MNVIKFSWAISRVNVESDANVSETSCVSIIRVSLRKIRKRLTLSHVYNEVSSEPAITRYTSIVTKAIKVLMLPYKHSMWQP
jgi:hypothetical protein